MIAVGISNDRIRVSWTDNSLSEAGFTLYRSDDGGDTWEKVTSQIPTNATSFLDTGTVETTTTWNAPGLVQATESTGDAGLVEGTDYTYKVQAQNTGGSSAASAASQATTTQSGGSGHGNTGGGADDRGRFSATDRPRQQNADLCLVGRRPAKGLIIGFSGHTQSMGMAVGSGAYADYTGPIWDIKTYTGTYKLGQQIQGKGYAVTLFPEDPGNMGHLIAPSAAMG